MLKTTGFRLLPRWVRTRVATPTAYCAHELKRCNWKLQPKLTDAGGDPKNRLEEREQEYRAKGEDAS